MFFFFKNFFVQALKLVTEKPLVKFGRNILTLSGLKSSGKMRYLGTICRVGIVKKRTCWETSRDTSEPIVFFSNIGLRG